MTRTADMTTGAFIDALAAQQSTPGGGGAAAVTGSQAAALISMVINFTIGKKKYAAVEEEMRQLLSHSEQLRADLLALADSDVAAFNAVAATYGMPKETDAEKVARTTAMQSALKQATQVPFAIAEKCLQVMGLAIPVGGKGNTNVVSDAVSGLYLANAALLCAIANVNINLKSLQDATFVADYTRQRDALMAAAERTYADGRATIAAVLGVPL